MWSEEPVVWCSKCSRSRTVLWLILGRDNSLRFGADSPLRCRWSLPQRRRSHTAVDWWFGAVSAVCAVPVRCSRSRPICG